MEKKIILKSIPRAAFPQSDVLMEPSEEELVDLEKEAPGLFLYDLRYKKQGIFGAIDRCLLRKGAFMRLKAAQELLPEDLRLCIYDAYRPFLVQESLYKKYEARMIFEHPEADEKTIEKLTCFFVSKPSKDPYKPSVHSTGGAVDLTIVDKNGVPLDMGTDFDCFDENAHTAFFEDCAFDSSKYEEIRMNRRLLYTVMTKAGFTNLPTEWWHYDYGDRFWAYYKNKPAKYTGIMSV